MKKTIAYLQIALHFAKMNVAELLTFASSILLNHAADPDVVIDEDDVTALEGEIGALNITVVARETDKSGELTITEGLQATAILIRLTTIAGSVEKQANEIEPGNIVRAQLAYTRIGFVAKKAPTAAERFFEVFKTLIGKAFIRIKADKTYSLYHWRWSVDGENWNRIADSRVASIVIFNLPSQKVIYFQSAVTLKVRGVPQIDANNPEPEWGDSISQLIP